jgi:hypothetical protein
LDCATAQRGDDGGVGHIMNPAEKQNRQKAMLEKGAVFA